MAEITTRRVLAVLEKMGKPEVPLDVDLVSSGILDSLDFLELVSSLESEFQVELDFSGLDPERFTTLVGLVDAFEGADRSRGTRARRADGAGDSRRGRRRGLPPRR